MGWGVGAKEEKHLAKVEMALLREAGQPEMGSEEYVGVNAGWED
jgi:hypothetical protein